jgi:hypothetical protein
MQLTLSRAVAGRLTLFGDTLFSPIMGRAVWRFGSHDYAGAPGVSTGRLREVSEQCEWYAGPEYALLASQRLLREEAPRGDLDATWMAESDGCCWLSPERQFVFEIRTGRAFGEALEAASRSTVVGDCEMGIDCEALRDAGVWWRRSQANFDAFMDGAPIYFRVSGISLSRRGL